MIAISPCKADEFSVTKQPQLHAVSMLRFICNILQSPFFSDVAHTGIAGLGCHLWWPKIVLY